MLYAALTPEVVLDALRGARACAPTAGCCRSTATRTASTRSGSRTAPRVVLKFYRPGRWSAGADRRGARLRARARRARDPGGRAAAHAATHRRLPLRASIRAAAAARRSSTIPKTLEWIGRFIGRIHAVGATRPFEHRASPRLETLRRRAARLPARARFHPGGSARRLEGGHRAGARRRQTHASSAPGRSSTIRLHGDCHPGNILWTDGRARISSTSTTRAWGRRCRTCGCCSRATAPR